MARASTPRILVIGGGYIGMYTALRLQRRLAPGEAEITVVEPRPYMTYQPLLPEAAAGAISPRHVVVPLRRVLPGCRIVVGEARSVDPAKRTAVVATPASEEEGADHLELRYDQLVVAPGCVSRTVPVPGLAEHGVGFRTVEEAIGLRNHVLEQLDIASSTRDADVREAALTFVFVGGGYAGVEALAELENMARYAVRHYHNVRAEDLRWVLVEASARLLPEADEALGRYVLRELRRRNVDVRLETRLRSCRDRLVVLTDGDQMPARTLVWTAGVRPAPLLAETGLPVSVRGRVRTDAALRVDGFPGVWSAGDAADVPDLAAGLPDAVCEPNAQHAVRQARVLADNLTAGLRGGETAEYRHKLSGDVVSLGLHEGVARVRGRTLTGYPAWLVHRAYHLSRLPTFNRKARVLAEWTLSGFFKREIVSLGSLEHPRAEFERAAGPDQGPDTP
jgi:NADH dehydrogenase